MSNISFIRGGTPVVKFIWDENTTPEYRAPFSENNLDDTPPYDSHADGAYNLGHFVLGMPIKPVGAGMTWQKKLLSEPNHRLAAGDVIQLCYLPADHIATFLNLKSVQSDEHLAGAQISLVAQILTFDDDGNEVYTEDSDFDAAVTAQCGANAFELDGPFNAFVSLMKSDSGYAVPMYSSPALPAKDASSKPTAGKYVVFGIKIKSLPTDSTVSLADMRKGIYFSVHMDAFECPTNY